MSQTLCPITQGSSLHCRHSSRTSSVVVRKCANADANRAQVGFTEKEAAILIQNAFLAEQEKCKQLPHCVKLQN